MRTETIHIKKLLHGLRPSEKFPRNNGFLVTCDGAVGMEGVLHTLDECDRLDTHGIDASFPYPQIFVFINTIIVCSEDTIYELAGGALVEKLIAPIGSTWVTVDFYDYVYLSNHTVAVVRDSASKIYSIVDTLPTAMAMLNFNGQVMISQSGGVSVIEEILNVYASPIVVTTSIIGDGIFISADLICYADPLEPDQAMFGDGHSAKDCIEYLYSGTNSVLTFPSVPAAAVGGITYYDFKHYLIVPPNVTIVIENNVRLRFYQVGAERGGLVSGGPYTLPDTWVFEDLTTYGFAVWLSQMSVSNIKLWGGLGDNSTDNFKAITGAGYVFDVPGIVQIE